MSREEKDRDEKVAGLSRRSFLRGTAGAGLASLIACGPDARGEAEMAEGEEARRREAGVEVLGPGAVAIELTINGEAHAVIVEPRTTLLDALRQDVGLTGAKRVCDRGTCGACTVLADGRPVYACALLAVASQGVEIETVESFGTPDELHPLQQAFVDHDGQQCGFCTPGFVVAAKAVLDGNPQPSPDEVAEGLSGNFCRCGTYAGIEGAMESMRKGGRHG
jgi:xanthine dehydrogenase YagT iron-sulfur-binding subunit